MLRAVKNTTASVNVNLKLTNQSCLPSKKKTNQTIFNVAVVKSSITFMRKEKLCWFDKARNIQIKKEIWTMENILKSYKVYI